VTNLRRILGLSILVASTILPVRARLAGKLRDARGPTRS
jgi:hypothetical protein